MIFILYLFSLLIVNGPVAIVNLILTRALSSFGDPSTRLIVTAGIQGIVSLVTILIYYPLQMTAFTLIYFDLRVRTEGFDLALLTINASELTDATQAMIAPVPQSNERLITGAELGNFAILTLVAAGLYIFLVAFIFGGVLFLGSLF
jgi:hypothetical protein